MRRSRKLGELLQCVFKDLVIVPTVFPPCVSERMRVQRKNGAERPQYFVSFNERGGIFSSRFQ